MAELTLEEYKTQLKTAVTDLGKASKDLEKAQAANQKLTAENTDAAKANKMLKADLEVVKGESAAKDSIIAALEAELATTKTQVAGGPKTAVLGGKKYRATMPKFRHKGIVRTAEEVLSDEEFLAELVAMGSGAVEEVTDEE